MSLWRQLTRGARPLVSRSGTDGDIANEVGQYPEEATAAARRSERLSAEKARRAIRLGAGNATALEEQIRGSGWETALETIGADLRCGARLLRKPAFTAFGTLTLGLGIGASTAIFSAVNPVLFEPLPYPAGPSPERR